MTAAPFAARVIPTGSRAMFAKLPDLLSVDNMADVLQCSGQTVRRMLRDGELPGVRIGRRWYTPRETFIDFVERGVHGSA